jgi:SnoaL-like protein
MSDPTLQDLLARIQRLEDIEAIKQLKHRYLRSIDTADIATLATLLADDIEVDYKGGSYHWAVSGKHAVLDSIAAGFHSRAIAQHTGHHPEIEINSTTSATGLWYLTDSFTHLDTLHVTAGSALYRDHYAKQNGTWLIKRSSYTRIYEVVDRIERAPNVTFSLLATTGRSPAS